MNKRNAPRVPKTLRGSVGNETGVIENVSLKGGFIRLKNIPEQGKQFDLHLQLSKHRSLNIQCIPKWSNAEGFGFEILSVENRELFQEFLARQIKGLETWGEKRHFEVEEFIGLGSTQMFGTAYFATFEQLQGNGRDKMLLHHVPLSTLMTSGVVLATVCSCNTFKGSAYFGDYVTMHITTYRLETSRCGLIFRFYNKENKKLICVGGQVFCALNMGKKVTRLPAFFDFLGHYEELEAPAEVADFLNRHY